MYSSIFVCKSLIESVRDLSSITKSGQIGGNCSCSAAVSLFHRSFRTQERSGDLLAPFGRENTVDESNPCPDRFDLTHWAIAPINMKFCLPVFPPVGAMTIKSPSLVRSIRKSGLSLQNS